MDDLPGKLGKRIRRFRRARKMKLDDLARATQINAKYLSRIELGQVSTSLSNLKLIADALDINLPILLDYGNTLSRKNIIKSLRERIPYLSDDALLPLLKIVSALPSSEDFESTQD